MGSRHARHTPHPLNKLALYTDAAHQRRPRSYTAPSHVAPPTPRKRHGPRRDEAVPQIGGAGARRHRRRVALALGVVDDGVVLDVLQKVRGLLDRGDRLGGEAPEDDALLRGGVPIRIDGRGARGVRSHCGAAAGTHDPSDAAAAAAAHCFESVLSASSAV